MRKKMILFIFMISLLIIIKNQFITQISDSNNNIYNNTYIENINISNSNELPIIDPLDSIL